MAVIYLRDFLILISDLNLSIFNFYYLTIISIGLGIIFRFKSFLFSNNSVITKNQYQLIFQLSGLTLNILNIYLLPKLGLLGAGISTLFGYFLIFIVNQYHFKIPTERKTTFLQMLALFISCFVTIIFYVSTDSEKYCCSF